MENEDVKITIILKNAPNNLLANATVCLETVIYGFLTIKGFQIWHSDYLNERLQEAINIQPPTTFKFGRAYQQVYFEDKAKWFQLETEIYNAYLKTKNVVGNTKSEDKLDLDEISKVIS